MRVFISAGEPSGDMHGANLTRVLRRLDPSIEVIGFGGDRMAEAGCRLLFPLAETAVMGLGGIVSHIPTFWRILGQARDEFRTNRPDALVMIDYPGFHWWLAGSAKKHGVPVSYFVPPQLWAWAGWRVRKMRRLTDQVLSSLPFEHDWFAERGVKSQYIGHPYFDELQNQRLDEEFLRVQRQKPGPILALLPGSRGGEMKHSRHALAKAVTLIHQKRPDVRFLVACLKDKHANELRPHFASLNLPIEVHFGKTPEIIELAHSCLSVSGSVSLELLYREKPSAMFYHMGPATALVAKMFFHLDSFTLVNLLAKRHLYPEYITSGREVRRSNTRISENLPDVLANHALHWLEDRVAYDALRGQLRELKRQVAQPGACERAAGAILALGRGEARQAA